MQKTLTTDFVVFVRAPRMLAVAEILQVSKTFGHVWTCLMWPKDRYHSITFAVYSCIKHVKMHVKMPFSLHTQAQYELKKAHNNCWEQSKQIKTTTKKQILSDFYTQASEFSNILASSNIEALPAKFLHTSYFYIMHPISAKLQYITTDII